MMGEKLISTTDVKIIGYSVAHDDGILSLSK